MESTSREKRFDCDQAAAIPARLIRHAAFAVVQRLGGNPEHLLISCAYLFLSLCRHYGLRPRRALEIAGRQMNEAHYNDVDGHYKTLANFMNGELPGGYTPVESLAQGGAL